MILILQLESRKNAIEIELNERLWRSRRDLQTRVETLIEESCESTSRENLDVRTRELRALNGSVEILTKRAQGDAYYIFLQMYLPLMLELKAWRRIATN
jgi:hypothetical protein